MMMNTYIYFALLTDFLSRSHSQLDSFRSHISHSPLPPTPRERLTAPDNSRQFGRNTAAKHGITFSYRKYVSQIKISMYIIIQTTPFFLNFDVASHIQIHTFSQHAYIYFAAMYFFVSTRTYTLIYVCE